MSPRPWQDRVRDILAAAHEIKAFTSGMTFEQFAQDRRTLKAVLADLTIIGEAANHLPAEVGAQLPRIPWPLIRRMRNIMVHAFFGVDEPTVWQTLQEDIDPLIAALSSLQLPPPPTDDQ